MTRETFKERQKREKERTAEHVNLDGCLERLLLNEGKILISTSTSPLMTEQRVNRLAQFVLVGPALFIGCGPVDDLHSGCFISLKCD